MRTFDFLYLLFRHRLVPGESTKTGDRLTITFLGDHRLSIKVGDERHELDVTPACRCQRDNHIQGSRR